MSHPFGGQRRAPRPYRWSFVDYALFAIPLAAVVLTAAGSIFGWS